jgi:hypothetical protein
MICGLSDHVELNFADNQTPHKKIVFIEQVKIKYFVKASTKSLVTSRSTSGLEKYQFVHRS